MIIEFDEYRPATHEDFEIRTKDWSGGDAFTLADYPVDIQHSYSRVPGGWVLESNSFTRGYGGETFKHPKALCFVPFPEKYILKEED